MRDSKINYVVVGVFVIGMIAALLATVAVLTGRAGDTERYFAVYNNVAGIQRGSKVLFEGFQIGQVADIEPVAVAGETRFKVWMAVRAGWRIPDDSVARIGAAGLLSALAIDIDGGRSAAVIAPDSEIPSGGGGNLFAVMSDVAAQVTDLGQTALKPLLLNLNRQVDAAGQILADKAPELLANLILVSKDLAEKTPVITRNAAEFSQDLNLAGDKLGQVLKPENMRAIDSILANVDRSTGAFGDLAGDMRETRARLDQILAGLDRLVQGNRDNLETTLRDLRQTTSTIARSVDTISQDLEGAARNLNEFTREVRRNPGQLLRSRAAPDDAPARR